MDQPLPKDVSHYYSRAVQRTGASVMKKFYKYFAIPNIGNFAGGLPDPSYFPFDDFEAKVAIPDRFRTTPNDPVDPGLAAPSQKNTTRSKEPRQLRITVPHDSAQVEKTRKIDLAVALQYGTAQGLFPLTAFIRDLARTKMHPNVPYKGGPEIIPTCGSTDGFNKVLYMFTEVWDDRKDWVRDRPGMLCEEFAYMTAVQSAVPRGLNVVPVAIDAEGMLAEGPGGLKDVLENWDRSKGRFPHLLYTVTIGQNPTAGVLSVDRRRQIYRICQEYDILIVEDDPYWFLQYPSANELSLKYRGKPLWTGKRTPSISETWKTSGSTFLDSLVPSYLSIDTDGRVIRLDTFSKTVAPGCRLGWITAQPAVIAKLLQFTDLLTQQPSGFVQSMVAELIIGQQVPSHDNATEQDNKSEQNWHMDGWLRWLEGLRGNYERRMQTTARILELGKHKIIAESEAPTKELSPDQHGFEVVSRKLMYDFNFPMGGMFIWLRIYFENHPLFNHPLIPVENLSHSFFVWLTKPKYNLLVAPGTIFCPTAEILADKGPYYFRLCFAAVPEDILEKVSENYVSGSNDFFDIRDPQRILDMLREDEGSAGQTIAHLSTRIQSTSFGRMC